MTPFEFLEQATATIPSNRRANSVRRELYSHWMLKTADLVEGGMDPAAAEQAAMESLGDPAVIAAAYHVPRSPLRLGAALLAGAPLFITAVLTAYRPADIVLWLTVLGTVAAIAEPGASLKARFLSLKSLVESSRLIVAVAALSGIADAVNNFGGATKILLVCFVPWLAVLYLCWQRTSDSRLTPFAMGWMTSFSSILAGLLVFGLRLPGSAWSDGFSAISGILVPFSVFVLAYLWEFVQWMRSREGRLFSPRVTSNPSHDEDMAEV